MVFGCFEVLLLLVSLQDTYTHISNLHLLFFPHSLFSPTSLNAPTIAFPLFFKNLNFNYVMIPGENNDSHMNVLVTYFKWPTPAFVTPSYHTRIFLGKSPSLFINDQKNLWIREINKMTKWIIKKKLCMKKLGNFWNGKLVLSGNMFF